MRKLLNSELNRLSVEEFKASSKIPLVIVLDNVRSQHNVGSIFRTADAFRVESLYLCGITATPPNPEIHKSALGAEDSVKWLYFANSLEAIKELKQDGYIIVSIEQTEGSLPIENLAISPNNKYAIVFGNEVKGISQEVVDASDQFAEITQFGTKHSLNVSIAAGIIIWEFFGKLKNSFQ
jgi:tRNA G18 (ribose-2'-O)-methylase SpoU